MMRMRLKHLQPGVIAYALGLGNRVVYIACSLALSVGAVAALPGQPFSVSTMIPIGLLAISLFGAGYRDCWMFDTLRHCVVHVEGWALLVRRTTYDFSNIEAIRIRHFVKGSRADSLHSRPKGRNVSMVVWSLVLTDGSERDVEIFGERASAGRTQDAAKRIAAKTGLPYEEDREHDSAQPISIRDL